MPTLPIPLSGKVYRGIDDIELSDESYFIYDGYKTLAGGISRRPGLDLFHNFSNNRWVDALYYSVNQDYLYAVIEGNLWRLTYSAGTVSSTNLTSTSITANNPTYLAYDGTSIFACAGGRIIYSNGTAVTANIADADAPTSTRKIDWIDGYLLAITGSDNKFYFCDINDSQTWSALDFASAAGSPDIINTFVILNREIYLLGARTTEIWENDGVTPFSRSSGGFIQTGCIAPHAVFIIENQILWFNQEKLLCKSSGGGVETIRGRYDAELESLTDWENARGFRVDNNGHTWLVTQFPADARTIAYDVTADEWLEFGFWDPVMAGYRPFLGVSAVQVPEWNKVLVGGSDGKLYDFNTSYNDDNGDEIRLSHRTGHVDHGTSLRKRCNQLRFRAKRGSVVSAEPQLMVRWKDGNKNTWSEEKLIGLGETGETDMVRRLHNVGIFQARQWEFSCSDAVPITFTRAEVDVEVLG